MNRPSFGSVDVIAENDLVNIIESEAGNLDRRVGKDQFFKLDLQRLQIPGALFGKTIDHKTKEALLSSG